ncbi:MAG TPA: hypothetical protein VEZ44_05370 [bacterium]|nr:hypothetical protein [bacterium]
MRVDLDLPENLGADVPAGATRSYLAFRASSPKPAPEVDHRRHLLRFYVARALARSRYDTLLIRPVVGVGQRRLRVDVAARRGIQVALALCDYPETTPETLAKLAVLSRVDHVEVLLVRHAASRIDAGLHGRLRAQFGPREFRVVSVTLPPFGDPLECDTWIYAETLREDATPGDA